MTARFRWVRHTGASKRALREARLTRENTPGARVTVWRGAYTCFMVRRWCWKVAIFRGGIIRGSAFTEAAAKGAASRAYTLHLFTEGLPK